MQEQHINQRVVHVENSKTAKHTTINSNGLNVNTLTLSTHQRALLQVLKTLLKDINNHPMSKVRRSISVFDCIYIHDVLINHMISNASPLQCRTTSSFGINFKYTQTLGEEMYDSLVIICKVGDGDGDDDDDDDTNGPSGGLPYLFNDLLTSIYHKLTTL